MTSDRSSGAGGADAGGYPPRMTERVRATTLSLLLGALVACSPSNTSARPTNSAGSRPVFRTVTSIRPAGFALPSPLQREVVLEAGGAVYLLGGLNSSSTTLATVLKLDPVTGQITPAGSLVGPVHDGAGADIGGKLVVFAGGSGAGSNVVQSFDPATGKATIIGHLPVALSDLAAVQVNGTVYLIGGYDNHVPRAEIYATTDGRTFAKVAELPVGLRYPGVTLAGDVVVIAGGISTQGATSVVYAFDPVADTVSAIARLPKPVGHAATFTLGSQVYVVGGLDGEDIALTSVTVIDPASGAVHRLASLAQPVTDAGVVSLGTKVFILGGARAVSISTSVASVLVASTRKVRVSSGSASQATSSTPSG